MAQGNRRGHVIVNRLAGGTGFARKMPGTNCNVDQLQANTSQPSGVAACGMGGAVHQKAGTWQHNISNRKEAALLSSPGWQTAGLTATCRSWGRSLQGPGAPSTAQWCCRTRGPLCRAQR